MQRILLLITDLQIGGTPTVVRELAVRLNRAGSATVEVACLSPWGPVADQLRDLGVTVHALNARGPYHLPAVASRFVKLVRQGKYDTVVSFLVHANTVAAIASRFVKGDVKWIQSIQTTQPTPRWHWNLQRFVAMTAERLVVPSASVATCAHDWASVDREKITVIPNAVDPAEWHLSPVATATDVASPVAIGFIGRLDPVKRVPHLLQVITSLEVVAQRPIHIHIYGEGADRGRIEDFIAANGYGNKVTLHGAIAKPQDALDRIAVLVLPSIAEGFGLVLIEAMASGVPVVAMRVPGPVDVVRDGETGLLVNAHSPSELSFAIDRLIRENDLRQRLIRNGLVEVRERFSWDVVLGQYQRLLGIAP